jgi:HSP20 family protein
MAQLPARQGGRSILRFDPRDFEDVYDRLGQMIGLTFGDVPAMGQAAAWVPMADVSETDDEYIVEVELPGVNKDDVDIQLADHELAITGEIKETERGKLRRRTRRVGHFEYRLVLPGDVASDTVDAQLKDGVLTVTVHKAQAAKPHRVEIRG